MLVNHPKILFIADEIPQTKNAGSIQFYRLLQEYPPERLIVMGRQTEHDVEKLPCSYYSFNFPLAERLRVTRFTSFVGDAQALGFFLKPLPTDLEKIADSFKPEVIISLMQNITFYYPAYFYAKKKNIPLVLFCHDDAEHFSRIHKTFENHLLKRNSKIYQYATKRLCISPEMAVRWREKYGVPGDYIYPIASDDIISMPIQSNIALKSGGDNLTIGYAGSLAYGYLEGIQEILPILEKSGALMRIYSDKLPGYPESKNIFYAGFSKFAEQTWRRIQDECDAVIIPYSSETSFKNLYTTHFPSKLPEYIKLGLPIIINGPDYCNGKLWSNKYPRAILSCNTGNLFETLTDLLAGSFRMHLVEEILKIKDFENQVAREKLLYHLNQIA